MATAHGAALVRHIHRLVEMRAGEEQAFSLLQGYGANSQNIGLRWHVSPSRFP